MKGSIRAGEQDGVELVRMLTSHYTGYSQLRWASRQADRRRALSCLPSKMLVIDSGEPSQLFARLSFINFAKAAISRTREVWIFHAQMVVVLEFSPSQTTGQLFALLSFRRLILSSHSLSRPDKHD